MKPSYLAILFSCPAAFAGCNQESERIPDYATGSSLQKTLSFIRYNHQREGGVIFYIHNRRGYATVLLEALNRDNVFRRPTRPCYSALIEGMRVAISLDTCNLYQQLPTHRFVKTGIWRPGAPNPSGTRDSTVYGFEMIYPNYIAKVDLRGSVIVSGDSLVLTSQSLH
jgi:hypothetical protein